jgi:hypothetical protein
MVEEFRRPLELAVGCGFGRGAACGVFWFHSQAVVVKCLVICVVAFDSTRDVHLLLLLK